MSAQFITKPRSVKMILLISATSFTSHRSQITAEFALNSSGEEKLLDSPSALNYVRATDSLGSDLGTDAFHCRISPEAAQKREDIRFKLMDVTVPVPKDSQTLAIKSNPDIGFAP
jgi:hypothetical protein